MENDGHIGFAGQIQLLLQNLFLHVPGRQIVIVIQADLPQGHHLGMGQQGFQLIQVIRRRVLGLVGMDARGGIDERILLRQGDAAAGGGQIAAHADAPFHAALPQTGDGLGPVLVELFVVQMAMGIKQLHGFLLQPMAAMRFL